MPSPTEEPDFGSCAEPTPEGTRLRVRAQPRSTRTGIRGVRASRLLVAVHEAADKGKANRAVAVELAKVLDVPKSEVVLTAGATTRDKTFLINGLDLAAVLSALRNGNF